MFSGPRRPRRAPARRNPLGSGLGVSSEVKVTWEELRSSQVGSQSPRFGSRCFVLSGWNVWDSEREEVVAIPSVRVSVFRLEAPLASATPEELALVRRNPLGSGLGVSSDLDPYRGVVGR